MATEATPASRDSGNSGNSGSSGTSGGSTSTGGSNRSTRQRSRRGNPLRRLVQSLGLFISQILDELRKVVRPTGKELLNYTVVVIVFVLVIMGIVAALDFVFHRLVLLALAG